MAGMVAAVTGQGENPITAFVRHQGVMVLDGGLATALEARGFDLNDPLWSARLLLEAPDAIRAVHLDFLAAGADCITTASYQASLAGFRRRGLTDEEGEALLRLSVRLAVDARDEFWSDPANREERLRPLVAASVGPYGAFLADGSEYSGRYGVSDDELLAFHSDRWNLLAESEADLLACESIPSAQEAGVLLRLLRETPRRWAWMSFTCRDLTRLCDGSPMVDAARLCGAEERIAGVGVNCTSPAFIAGLIAEVRKGTDKPVVVYPNAGERYDAGQRAWQGGPPAVEWDAASEGWARLGAGAIGGCCRVTAADIRRIRLALLG